MDMYTVKSIYTIFDHVRVDPARSFNAPRPRKAALRVLSMSAFKLPALKPRAWSNRAYTLENPALREYKLWGVETTRILVYMRVSYYATSWTCTHYTVKSICAIRLA